MHACTYPCIHKMHDSQVLECAKEALEKGVVGGRMSEREREREREKEEGGGKERGIY